MITQRSTLSRNRYFSRLCCNVLGFAAMVLLVAIAPQLGHRYLVYIFASIYFIGVLGEIWEASRRPPR